MPTQPEHWIDTVPRVALGFLPTPLMPLDRLSALLGGPRLWMKRDDCTGLATGGNKTRKLEYLLAEARAANADVVITFGAVQSNHARQTAAACAATGMACHLILARKVPWHHPAYERSGNVQLDRLLGAHVHLVEAAEVADYSDHLVAELRGRGRKPYVIPVGGSNAIGALGYVRCARELISQCRTLDIDLTDVVHASSSAGTQAGLVAGFAGDDAIAVHGINVSEPDPASLQAAVWTIASAILRDHEPAIGLDRDCIRVDHRFFGTGYGIPTADTLDAIGLLGRTEGVLVDPVYSGKALGGVIARIRSGEFEHAADIVFIHTGGVAALPVYDDVL